jgi:hypothetical protein
MSQATSTKTKATEPQTEEPAQLLHVVLLKRGRRQPLDELVEAPRQQVQALVPVRLERQLATPPTQVVRSAPVPTRWSSSPASSHHSRRR